MQGFVLAGGDSRRMGTDKAEIAVDGEPLWRRQCRVLREAGAAPVILVRRPGQPAPAGIDVVRDRFADAGPMAGLHAALAAADGAHVAVLAVDMPGIDAGWFRWLLGFCRPGAGAMARHPAAAEPLAAVYPREAIGEVGSRLARGEFSLQGLAGALAESGAMTLVPLPAAEQWRAASLNTAAQAAAWRGDPAAALMAELRDAGLLADPAARLTPLSGGVSSDIYLVDDGPRRFVVKRALAKLRVKDDWFADLGRNRVERDYLAYARKVVPEAVPGVIHADPARDWFAMEYLGGGLLNWKSELLAGRADAGAARLAGATLGRLHAASWGDPVARATFDTLGNFTDLRIEPYLLSTAERVPAVAQILREEAARLAATRVALVHGDYSPKNLLVGPGRIVVLDAETAWYGDPAFDTGFLLNHLFLKALHRSPDGDALLALVGEAWRAYAAALGGRADAALEARTVRLVLSLMLARVHGKSPVEYLTDPEKRRGLSDFACRHLARPPETVAGLASAWRAALSRT
jgi:molybdopterin-guanine dinucleotide biosynthesis protein A/aminoglycoside phosphotransferase (APT) family kinase protein